MNRTKELYEQVENIYDGASSETQATMVYLAGLVEYLEEKHGFRDENFKEAIAGAALNCITYAVTEIGVALNETD